MLARLSSVPGIAEARADASGRYFWLTVSDGGDAARVADAAGDVLGPGARLLSPAAAEAQLAARAAGDPWLGPDEVMTLSFVEGRILSVRLAATVGRAAGTTPEEGDALAEAIRVELFAALRRVHAEGGRTSSGWLYDDWPAIGAAAAARCAAACTPTVAAKLPELLRGALTR